MSSKKDLSRRHFFYLTAVEAGSGLLIGCKTTGASDVASAKDPREVFPLNVASGDPLDNAIILWTKIAESSYKPGLPLIVEVSKDEQFTAAITREIADQTPAFGPDRDLTASFDFVGLAPYTKYFYRFIYDETTSMVGRFKTLASAGAKLERSRLAVLTCQDFTTGYFPAFSHLADQSDIDLVVHLGDFIYEYNAYPEFAASIVRQIGLTNGTNYALSLADFRKIHRTFRSDPHLQRALAAHAWLIVWDDHEIGNDSYYDYENKTPGLGYDAKAPHPMALTPADRKLPREALAEKIRKAEKHRSEAMQAWLEYIPARTKMVKPAGQEQEVLQIYRSVKQGDFLELFITDSRTFRSEPPCGDQSRLRCDDHKDPVSYAEDTGGPTKNSMLGGAQARWLIEGINNSDCAWKIWANQTLLGQLALTTTLSNRPYLVLNYDAWDGFQSERAQILEKVSEVDNFVVLTGDFHTAMAVEVKAKFSRGEKVIGFELMTPSISSPNFQDAVKNKVSWLPRDLTVGTLLLNNKHVRYLGADVYGYSVLELVRVGDENKAYWTIYHIDKLREQPALAGVVKHDLAKSKFFEYDPEKKVLSAGKVS